VVYTLPRFDHRRAAASCATAHTLSAPGPSAPRRARAACGRGPRPAADQADSGLCYPGLFDTVAGPRQAERALCVCAELGFGEEAV
jgi:hypothetical protein